MPGKYNVSAYPTLVVIDKSGRISGYLVGGRSEAELRAAVDRGRAGAVAKPSVVPLTASSAPEPVSPPVGATFSHVPRTTQVTWKPLSGAIGYVIEWDYKDGSHWWSEAHSGAMTKLVQDTAFTFEHVGAQAGRWRVWAVLSTGGTSAKSAWQEFSYSR